MLIDSRADAIKRGMSLYRVNQLLIQVKVCYKSKEEDIKGVEGRGECRKDVITLE